MILRLTQDIDGTGCPYPRLRHRLSQQHIRVVPRPLSSSSVRPRFSWEQDPEKDALEAAALHRDVHGGGGRSGEHQGPRLVRGFPPRRRNRTRDRRRREGGEVEHSRRPASVAVGGETGLSGRSERVWLDVHVRDSPGSVDSASPVTNCHPVTTPPSESSSEMLLSVTAV